MGTASGVEVMIVTLHPSHNSSAPHQQTILIDPMCLESRTDVNSVVQTLFALADVLWPKERPKDVDVKELKR